MFILDGKTIAGQAFGVGRAIEGRDATQTPQPSKAAAPAEPFSIVAVRGHLAGAGA